VVLLQQEPNRVQSRKTMSAIRVIPLFLLMLILAGPTRGWTEDAVDNSSALHLLAGASGALLVSAVAYPLVDVGSDQGDALMTASLGVCGALILGSAKELSDMSGWGQPQWSDLLLTVGGGLLAASAVYALSCLEPGAAEENLGISAVYGAFGLILSLPVGENLLRRFRPSLRSRS
jgi:hypothetical protein